MSCSSLKHRFEQLKSTDHLDFHAALNLYRDVKGSLDAHRIELYELKKSGDSNQISHLEDHIHDGQAMLHELERMTLH